MVLTDSHCFICSEGNDCKLQKHHIVPRRYGGSDSEENLVTLCANCHRAVEALYDDRFYDRLEEQFLQEVLEERLTDQAISEEAILETVTEQDDGRGVWKAELQEALSVSYWPKQAIDRLVTDGRLYRIEDPEHDRVKFSVHREVGVIVTEECDAVRGKEGQTYGPFRPGECPDLPQEVALRLVREFMAEFSAGP
ncbi:HNH endonuclease [Halomontanus rarus]|uniref:HNH endonuclease n=1 Tax=Halomontanus rarus TaxID=3034020 RepID=UPI001F621F47